MQTAETLANALCLVEFGGLHGLYFPIRFLPTYPI